MQELKRGVLIEESQAADRKEAIEGALIGLYSGEERGSGGQDRPEGMLLHKGPPAFINLPGGQVSGLRTIAATEGMVIAPSLPADVRRRLGDEPLTVPTVLAPLATATSTRVPSTATPEPVRIVTPTVGVGGEEGTGTWDGVGTSAAAGATAIATAAP